MHASPDPRRSGTPTGAAADSGPSEERRPSEAGPAPLDGHGVLLGVLLLALVVRLVRLGGESLWFDEAFSVAAARGSWRELFDAVIADGRHPPLSFLVLKGSLAALGGLGVEVAARLPSLFASTVEVLLCWRLGRRLAGPRAALLCAVLLALAQLSVRHAQEARMYALASCLVAAAALLVARALLERRPDALVAAGLFGGLALLTHYWTAFSLLGLVAWAFVLRRRHPLPARAWLGAAVASAVVVAPWCLLALPAQLERAGELLAAGAPEWGRVSWLTPLVAPALLAGGEQPRLGSLEVAWALVGAWVLLLVPAVLGAVRGLRSREARKGVLGLVLLVTPPLVLSLLAAALSGAQFAVRYLLPVLGPLLLLASLGLLAVRPRALRRAAVACALAFSVGGVVAVWRGGWKPPWRELVAELEARAEPGDAVLWLPAGRVPLQWGIYGGEGTKLLRLDVDQPVDERRVWLAAFASNPVYEGEIARRRRLLGSAYASSFSWSAPPLSLELFVRR